MLVFGDHTCLFEAKNMMIYNLSSLIEGYPRLDLLPPYTTSYDEKQVDIDYANYIMTNDYAFYNMMNIVVALVNGFDVFILIGTEDVHEFIAESLQKFIQQRYGLISYFIHSPEDIANIHDVSMLSINGVYNFDQDSQRSMRLFFMYNPEVAQSMSED